MRPGELWNQNDSSMEGGQLWNQNLVMDRICKNEIWGNFGTKITLEGEQKKIATKTLLWRAKLRMLAIL